MTAHAHDHVRTEQRSSLRIVLALNAVFMAVELVGGFAFDSLALLADAAHMATDVVALAIALWAQRLIERPPSTRLSYGLQRAEVLAAALNALVLVGLSLWIAVEAIGRLDAPQDVSGGGLLAVALAGLTVNLWSAWFLAKSAHGSLNMRGALLHMMADALGSFGAVCAGIAVVLWDFDRADPLISIALAAFVAWAAVRLMVDTTHVLLEGTPRGTDPAAVTRALEADPEVQEVHHLHLWSLASDVPALSAHVVLANDMTLHDAQLHGDRLRSILEERFGIAHATLELECHSCESVVVGPSIAENAEN